jgi:hypothetical protein
LSAGPFFIAGIPVLARAAIKNFIKSELGHDRFDNRRAGFVPPISSTNFLSPGYKDDMMIDLMNVTKVSWRS